MQCISNYSGITLLNSKWFIMSGHPQGCTVKVFTSVFYWKLIKSVRALVQLARYFPCRLPMWFCRENFFSSLCEDVWYCIRFSFPFITSLSSTTQKGSPAVFATLPFNSKLKTSNWVSCGYLVENNLIWGSSYFTVTKTGHRKWGIKKYQYFLASFSFTLPQGTPNHSSPQTAEEKNVTVPLLSGKVNRFSYVFPRAPCSWNILLGQ